MRVPAPEDLKSRDYKPRTLWVGMFCAVPNKNEDIHTDLEKAIFKLHKDGASEGNRGVSVAPTIPGNMHKVVIPAITFMAIACAPTLSMVMADTDSENVFERKVWLYTHNGRAKPGREGQPVQPVQA